MGSTSESDAELHDRIHQQEAVVELGQQALETDELDRLLQDATEVVAETLDAEYCKVLELRPGGNELLLRHGVGWEEGLVGTATVPTGTGSQAGYMLGTDEPVVVDDLSTEKRFSGPDLLVDHDVVSGMSVVIGSSDDPWGILGVHTTERRAFTEHDRNFVRNVSNVLASTIDNRETERRLETEKRIREQLVETSPVGIVVVGADGTLRFANERAEEIYGRSREELEAYSHNDSRWDLVGTHGDPFSADETPFEQVLGTGVSIFDMELGLRQPDGQRVWISVNGSPLRIDDDDGSAIFAFTDISEQKRLEVEFTEILGRVSDAFYALDDELRFTHVNERAEELLQHPEEELLGENLWDVFPSAAEIDEVWGAFQTARDEQVQTSYELYYDTLEFWVEANLYPSETGISVYFRDISDQVRRERSLKRSNERLEQFAYSASHDLQEPLRMVSSYLQLIERRYSDALDEDGEEFLEFAIDGADRMRAMIRSLLEYSKVETRGEPLVAVGFERVTENVLDDLRFQIEDHDAEITVEELPRVEGDPDQLRQLLQNILSNAFQYSGDEPPEVHISAERSDSMWTISVRDEGIGIDPDETSRIFEVFERLHSREEHPGTGIGLALAQRIVERHGGEIWAESEPDEGATFSFTLPAVEASER